jgi:hypothetical protein
MRARWRGPITDELPVGEARFVAPRQIFLSLGTDYEVHAVSVYDGIVFLQVIDDLNTPVLHPRVLFDIVDPSIPHDWICNTFPAGPVQLVQGPTYVAASLEAYDAMVDQAEPAVTAFWNRVAITRGRASSGERPATPRPTVGDTIRFTSVLLHAVHARRVATVCELREVDTDEQAAVRGCPKGTLLLLVELGGGVMIEVPETLVEVLESS